MTLISAEQGCALHRETWDEIRTPPHKATEYLRWFGI